MYLKYWATYSYVENMKSCLQRFKLLMVYTLTLSFLGKADYIFIKDTLGGFPQREITAAMCQSLERPSSPCEM